MEAAASLIGVTRQCWCDWEHGRRVPRDGMAKVCQLTGLEPNDFYPEVRRAPRDMAANG